MGWLFLSKGPEVSHLRDRFTLFAFSTVLSQGQYIHLYHVDSAAAFVLPPVRGSLLFKSLNLVFPRSEVKFSTARDASGSRVTLDAYLRKDPQPLDITTSLLYCLLFMAPSLYLAVDSARWMDLSQLAFCPARPLRLVPIPAGTSTAGHSSVTGGIALSCCSQATATRRGFCGK
jgi:hypothetical protein